VTRPPSVTVAVLTDFGSTYTKVTLVDAHSGALVARGQAPTSVATDVMDGFGTALGSAVAAAEQPVVLGPRIASSSAGGGLRVTAVGLVSDLTAAAARQAALNAGGRVDLVLSGSLDASDKDTLRAARPDIVLFSGGTDGGQRERVLHNADIIAASGAAAEVVVACNREIAEDVTKRFERAGMRAHTVENTMPRLGELNIGAAREAILQAFLVHVIRGKGLSMSPEFAESVVTATPDAVLRAVELLATGTPGRAGLGSVAAVDVGGATTDVHSHVDLDGAGVVGSANPLLPVPPTVRTVEGDLGMRWSAGGVLTADRTWLTERLGAGVDQDITLRETVTDSLPMGEHDAEVDRALGTACVTHALQRHCGRQFWAIRVNEPPRLTKTGPDLRAVQTIVGTGGVLALGADGVEILEASLARVGGDDALMTPDRPRVIADRHYVLAAAGLLATYDRELALQFIANEFAVANETVSGSGARH
jgi:uncharacterized protein (TIGR01319 family)